MVSTQILFRTNVFFLNFLFIQLSSPISSLFALFGFPLNFGFSLNLAYNKLCFLLKFDLVSTLISAQFDFHPNLVSVHLLFPAQPPLLRNIGFSLNLFSAQIYFPNQLWFSPNLGFHSTLVSPYFSYRK